MQTSGLLISSNHGLSKAEQRTRKVGKNRKNICLEASGRKACQRLWEVNTVLGATFPPGGEHCFGGYFSRGGKVNAEGWVLGWGRRCWEELDSRRLDRMVWLSQGLRLRLETSQSLWLRLHWSDSRSYVPHLPDKSKCELSLKEKNIIFGL